jgi:hypothetical protein
MIARNWLLRGMIARRNSDMGGRDSGRRTRALGTRDRVLSYLADGEISDPKGMASTVLAEAVGYPGSSAAFAQLLSGMERSGLIEREIRGKRTYRIAATAAGSRRGEGHAGGSRRGEGSAAGSRRGEGSAAGSRRGEGSAAGDRRDGADVPGSRRGPGGRGPDGGPAVTAGHGRQQRAPAAGESDRPGDLVAPPADAADFDYDELARRLLVQVVRRLAVSPGDGPLPGYGSGGPQGSPGLSGAGRAGPGLEPDAALQQTVAGLEQKLASVRSRQRRLTAENARLREQLRAAQQSLAEAEERASAARVTGQLGSPELQLLERLLSATRDQPGRQEEAGAG